MTSTTKIDLTNWRISPYNRWSFVNVDKILNTNEIRKSETVSPLPSEPRQFDDFHLEHNGKILDLAAFLTESECDGLLILQHGKVLYETYLNDNTKGSKHILMSVTKSVVGLLVGILQSQGKLNMDDTISKHIPEVSDSFHHNVTIRQAIDMRSGAKSLDASHEYRAASGSVPLKGDEKYTNLHDYISNLDPERMEDDRFEYVSLNTDVIGWLVEKVGGKSLAEMISELLWQPMGAESDALMATDTAGNARAAGGMCATLRDLARIGQLIVDGGRGIVPAEWINDVVHNGDKDAFARGSWASGFRRHFAGCAYRSYCLADSESETVMGLGIFGQMLLVDRKNGIVVAKTGSQVEATDRAKTGLTVAAFKEFQRILVE
ncbi:6-aminohexanoate-dimer hydrolase like protein [Zymoseptoria brevis]|uniref:6-aminohexanoate-dimer hydrolase like protein n=1 Tax=Zymoseptoria brevis TaxID=1047168 RepID=A0A0F4GRK9_9PEZI|nr:6-aminohexanoate-dimer hydrolase like protein [Zymoseptoria brevis]